MGRPRILYVFSSLAASDLGGEIVSIHGRLSWGLRSARGRARRPQNLLRRFVELKVDTNSLGLDSSTVAAPLVRPHESLAN